MENAVFVLVALLFLMGPLLLIVYGEYRHGLFRPELQDEPSEPKQPGGSIFSPDDTVYTLFFSGVSRERGLDLADEIENRARELAAEIAAESAVPREDLIKLAHFKHEALELYLEALEALQEVVSEMNAQRARSGGASTRGQSTKAKAVAPSGWRKTLWLAAGECNPEAIKKAYRRMAMEAHPDRGGSNEAMAKLSTAYRCAKAELGFN